jgi:hypothetical protein
LSKKYLEKLFTLNIEMNLSINGGEKNNTIMHIVDIPQDVEIYLRDELCRLNNLILAYSNIKSTDHKSDIFWVSILKGNDNG